MRRLILDTDGGVDDAYAIVLALHAHAKTVEREESNSKSSPDDVRLEAITVVQGNVGVDQATENIGCIMALFPKLDIPYYKGAAHPMVQSHAPPDWQGHGTDGIGNMEFKELLKNAPKPQKEHAALALLRMVEEAPDQTYSIVAIGPLTNVALAIKMSPDPTVFSRKLVDLVWMGGTHSATGNSTATAEFNAWADPEAAKVVFDSLPSKITMVGWEATVAHDLPWKWFDEHVKPSAEAEAPSETASSRTPIDRVLSTREFLWLATTHYERTCRVPGSPFEFLVCDALAMAVWLQPSLTKKVANLYCTVELAGKYTRGMVVLDHYGVLKRTAKADDMTAEGKERRFVKVVYTFDHDMYERLLIEAIGN